MLKDILLASGSVVIISVLLAVIISIAEHYLNNYGVCKLDINDGEKVLEVNGGSMLLQTLAQEKIFIPSACGGKATCGLCKLRVLEGAGPILPTEEPYLSPEERANGTRLSCQIKVKNSMKLFIPEELFNIQAFECEVERLTDMTYDMREVRLRLPEDMRIKFKAGQFMQFYTKPYDKVKEEVFRAYSISSSPNENDHLEFMIRRIPDGIASNYVHTALHEGDKVQVTGPYGQFYLRGGEGIHELIMICGASGLAPIASLLRYIMEEKLDYQVRVYFSVSTMKDIFYFDKIEQWCEEFPNITFIPSVTRATPEDGWTGETRRIPEILKDDLDSGEGREAYMCGAPALLNASVKALEEIGFRRDQIFFDEF